MSAVIYVALGGAGGSVLRYLVALAVLGPWATLAVAVAGSPAIGVAAGLGSAAFALAFWLSRRAL